MAEEYKAIEQTSSRRQGTVGKQVDVSTYPPGGIDKVYGFSNSDEAELYTKWANLYSEYDEAFSVNSYFDYYFSGQDIFITIDGLDSTDVLPMYQFGFNIEQNKKPLYGFWDYTYRYMMRGTRIVSGAFSLISVRPGYLTEKVALAAKRRADKAASVSYPLRGLDEDDANIQKYWRRNYDPSLDAGQQHLFSTHPPFNIIINYGIQDTSLREQVPSDRVQEIRNKFANSTALMSDLNERLVEANSDTALMRVILENVEIVNMQTTYDTSGDPVLETYSFMARDIREAPKVALGTGQQQPSSSGTASGPTGTTTPGQGFHVQTFNDITATVKIAVYAPTRSGVDGNRLNRRISLVNQTPKSTWIVALAQTLTGQRNFISETSTKIVILFRDVATDTYKKFTAEYDQEGNFSGGFENAPKAGRYQDSAGVIWYWPAS